MTDVRTPAKRANSQLMNESTPRPRTVLQRRTQSAMSHSGIKINCPFKSRARGGNASDVMGEDKIAGFRVQSATFHANNGGTSNLDFESDEEFKREHDLQKIARQSRKSFRTTPENVSEIELMSSIEAEKEQHRDTAAKLHEVCAELDSTKQNLQASLKHSFHLEETNAAISKEVDALQKKLETAESQLHEQRDKLQNRIVTLRNNLETSATALAEKKKVAAKKIATLKSHLREVTIARDSAITESSQLTEDNASLQRSIADVGMQLTEAKEVNSASVARTSQLEEEKKSMSNKIEGFEIQLKQTVDARDAAQQEAISLKDSFHIKYSRYFEAFLDQLKISTTETHSPVGVAESNYLQDRVQDLKDSRDIDVHLISHFFKEREDLTNQIAKLQAEIKDGAQSRAATSLQVSEILNDKNTVVQENAVLIAQLIEVRSFLEFAQKQILRLEQETIADDLSSQERTNVENIQSIIQVKQIIDEISNEESENDSAALLLEIEELKSLLEKEKTALESQKTKVRCSESSLRNVKIQLEKEQSAHQISTKKLEDLLQRDNAAQISSTAKAIDLQVILKKEKSEHQICKINLARAQETLRGLTATNETSLGKISQLENLLQV
ncbi:hypothetical protein IFR05_012184 [Cadophora sp. M221]|nr:hypothetical protein IFR05_012184 [Cadophora sp. M221]